MKPKFTNKLRSKNAQPKPRNVLSFRARHTLCAWCGDDKDNKHRSKGAFCSAKCRVECRKWRNMMPEYTPPLSAIDILAGIPEGVRRYIIKYTRDEKLNPLMWSYYPDGSLYYGDALILRREVGV